MRQPCNQQNTDDTQEKIVIPLFEIVVYPDSRTKFPVDQATGDLLLDRDKGYRGRTCRRPDGEKRYTAIELTAESLYKTGNLFRISHVQPADDGYLICAEVSAG